MSEHLIVVIGFLMTVPISVIGAVSAWRRWRCRNGHAWVLTPDEQAWECRRCHRVPDGWI